MRSAVVEQPPFEWELYARHPLRLYPSPIIALVVAQSVGSTASGSLTSTSVNPARRLSSGAVAASNNQFCNGEINQGVTMPIWGNARSDGKKCWGYAKRYRIELCPDAFVGVADQLQQVGMGIGQAQIPQTQSFHYSIVGGIDSPMLDLYIRADTMTWECLTFNGKSPNVAANRKQINALVGVPAPAIGKPQRAEIVYAPGEYVAFIVDGIEGFRQSDPARLPDQAANVAWVGAKYWVQSANDVASRTDAHFSSMMIYDKGRP